MNVPINYIQFQTKFIFSHDYYRPKRSFGQGNIFTSVCLSTGGVLQFFGGVSSNFRGAPNFRGGVSKFLGGLQISGGPPIFRGVLQFFGGVVSNFLGGLQPEYGQRSAGTHPTGMHSCYFQYIHIHIDR